MAADAYVLDGPIPTLLGRFETAQVAFQAAERNSARASRFAGYGCAGIVLGVIGGFGVGLLYDAYLGFALLLLMLVVFKYLPKSSGPDLARFRLDERKRAAVVRVLRMLNADTPRGAEVELRIDFRSEVEAGASSGGKNMREPHGIVSKTRTRHEWFRLSGQLVDGTRYELTAIDRSRRKVTIADARTRVKLRLSGTIQILLHRRTIDDAASLAQRLQTVSPPAPLGLVSSSAKGLWLRAELATPVSYEGAKSLVNSDMLLQSLLWAYDAIGRSREGGTREWGGV